MARSSVPMATSADSTLEQRRRSPTLTWSGCGLCTPKKPLGSLYLMAHLEVHFSGTTNVVVEVATLDHGLHSGLWGGAVPDGLSAGGCERPFGVS